MRRVQILVIGYNKDACDERAWRLAYEVGREVARKGAVLVTGGLGGVMEAASKGAFEEGGLTEIAAAYIEGKPIVALRGSGGVADEYAGRYLDQRKTVLIHAADTPSEAVELVLRLITERASTSATGKSGT
jgi:predicted Rossmann-fold nucleotide-binding protein